MFISDDGISGVSESREFGVSNCKLYYSRWSKGVFNQFQSDLKTMVRLPAPTDPLLVASGRKYSSCRLQNDFDLDYVVVRLEYHRSWSFNLPKKSHISFMTTPKIPSSSFHNQFVETFNCTLPFLGGHIFLFSLFLFFRPLERFIFMIFNPLDSHCTALYF